MVIHLRKLSDKIGVSYSRLSSWFKGSSNMKAKELESTLKELETNKQALDKYIEKARLEIELGHNKESLI